MGTVDIPSPGGVRTAHFWS